MIRRSRPEDARAVGEVFSASLETLDFLPKLHTHEEHLHFIAEIVPRDHEIWVAEENGAIVGLAAIGDGTLGHLYVHPDAHGRGHGSELFEKAKEVNPGGFTLWTFPANDTACRFYEKRGMRVVQYGDGSGNEERLPDVQYEWRPTPASAGGGPAPSGR